MIYLTIGSLLLSLAAIIISIKAWHKSRAIYGIETEVLRQPTGSRDDSNSREALNTKLSKGMYTILSVVERSKSDDDWELILGKIKKDKIDGTK